MIRSEEEPGHECLKKLPGGFDQRGREEEGRTTERK